jgi:hypothetical protein
MSGLELVSVNNDLAFDVKRTEIKNKIIARVNELGITIATYRLNNEFLLLVCNLVEHLVNKKKYKIDKKVLVVEILNQLFTLNAVEKANVESNIEFLWNNKNIKSVSRWKLFCVGVKECFGYTKK